MLDVPKSRKNGFTLAELLIVIAIIAILVVLGLMNVGGQRIKANDVKRKTDLYKLKNAIEEYHNDHDTFPPEGTISCGGAGLVPYLAEIPCDPKNPTARISYGYVPSTATGGYRVCTILEDVSDPAITDAGCGGSDGCGVGGGYNYCLASGTTASAVGTTDQVAGGTTPTATPPPGGTTPTATPTPTMAPIPGQIYWACTPGGICHSYTNPQCKGCPSWYEELTCGGLDCAIATNQCTDILVPNCP